MKKCIATLLLVACMLSCAFAEERNPSDTTDKETNQTLLKSLGCLVKLDTTSEAFAENQGNDMNGFRYYDNMEDAQQALKEGEINAMIGLPESVAGYIAAGDDHIASLALRIEQVTIEVRMATFDQELLAKLDNAISELKTDGTLGRLEEEHITAALIGKETPVALPNKDGARTLRVVVTGDLPPLDHITPDGQPEGFNIAVIAEIANRLGFNVELVKTESHLARVPMLERDEADVFFWLHIVVSPNLSSKAMSDPDAYGDLCSTQPCYAAPDNTLILE